MKTRKKTPRKRSLQMAKQQIETFSEEIIVKHDERIRRAALSV